MLSIDEVVKRFEQGEVIAFPTETSFGLGAHPFRSDAVGALFAVKGRSETKPPPLLVSGIEMARQIAGALPARAEQLMQKYWPGPVTIIVPYTSRGDVPLDLRLVSEDGIALRHSSHPIAQTLVERLGVPLPATSANRTGEPPLHSADLVVQQFGSRVAVLDASSTNGDMPTTLVHVDAFDQIRILRQGQLDLTDDL